MILRQLPIFIVSGVYGGGFPLDMESLGTVTWGWGSCCDAASTVLGDNRKKNDLFGFFFQVVSIQYWPWGRCSFFRSLLLDPLGPAYGLHKLCQTIGPEAIHLGCLPLDLRSWSFSKQDLELPRGPLLLSS